MDLTILKERSFRVRERIIRMSTDGGCFIGASLSAVETVMYLYSEFLNLPSEKDPDRDYFFLSKGHDVPALYGTLVELGKLDPARLKNHLSTEDHIYWHPNTKVPYVEFHSGSLGHLLSVSIGVAMALKLEGRTSRVVVLLGDGELNEGSNWEAMLVASAKKLDNLTLVVDRNQFQANVETESLIPLESLEDKFAAFGIRPQTVDGHDFSSLHSAFSKVPFEKGAPSAIIAKTTRGKGLPSIERRADRWFCNFSHDEVELLLKELRGEGKSDLTSETLTVR